MSERLASSLFEFDQKQIKALRKIGSRALEVSKERYCSGFPIYRGDMIEGFDYSGGSEQKLGFNNSFHNYIVGEGGARVAGAVDLSPSLQELARATGDAHDVRQLWGRGADERDSAAWIEQRIVEAGLFDRVVAKMGAKAILGTEPLFDADGPIKGKIIGQMAQQLEYDSKEEELFAKSVASADLGALYKPYGPYLGHQLYAQRQGSNAGETPDMAGFPQFYEKQAPFVENYRYLLPEAEGALATHRTQVTRYTNFVAEQLREGKIESWEQLRAQDIAFMRNPDMQLR
ncbi:MAG TPA: hypothetical protein VFH06_05080 [Candidatus Saccharimonadales bacterium]|nr:hypothetical protein [Candidatus Saccharimonadales bacterium]